MYVYTYIRLKYALWGKNNNKLGLDDVIVFSFSIKQNNLGCVCVFGITAKIKSVLLILWNILCCCLMAHFHSIIRVNVSLQCANIISSAAVCVTFQHV